MFTEFARFYDTIYAFTGYAAESAQVAALVRAADPGARTILDVACGTAEHARLLAARHGFEVDGLDLDPAFLAIARAKHPSGRFFEADMSDFALERQYDAVVCLFSSIGYAVTFDPACRALRFDSRRRRRTPCRGRLRRPQSKRNERVGGICVICG